MDVRACVCVAGELELMVHRRVEVDDNRGVQEQLNETMCGCNDMGANPGCKCPPCTAERYQYRNCVVPIGCMGIQWCKDGCFKSWVAGHSIVHPFSCLATYMRVCTFLTSVCACAGLCVRVCMYVSLCACVYVFV